MRELGGLGLACTDLLSPTGLICGHETSADLARTNDFDKPIGMQLYGADPQTLAQGAKWCADHGATVVDLNMGCPADKVCKRDGGSKLMCDLDRARRIAQAVREALPDSIPLTAKMRLGWTEADSQAGVAADLACKLADQGVDCMTIHGRTTEQRFKGSCRREGIKRVVEAVAAHTGPYTGQPGSGIPIIGNGDIRTPADVVSMIDQTGCAGIMIGRGAFGMPWIFRDAWALQTTGELPEPLSNQRKLEFVTTYFQRLLEFQGERKAMHTIRHKISWLGKGINGGRCRELKEAVRTAAGPQEVFAAIEYWNCKIAPDERHHTEAGSTPAV